MGILDLIFPINCVGCGRTGRYICWQCLEKAPLANLVCPYCEKKSSDGSTHFKCRRKLGIDGIFSIWEYKGAIRDLILMMKYRFVKKIAQELAESAHLFLQERGLFSTDFLLVPIPLHWYKRNFRGFNQSELMGRILSERMGWVFSNNLLFRKGIRAAQSELDRESRIKNIKNAFGIDEKLVDKKSLKKIIIFDDVCTTGSTLKEACLVLKRNGAEIVWGLTIAG